MHGLREVVAADVTPDPDTAIPKKPGDAGAG
jgi:hypothetical protein